MRIIHTRLVASRSFFGNVGVLVRAYCIYSLARWQRLREASEQAVLNANYLRSRISPLLPRAACRTVHARVRGFGCPTEKTARAISYGLG